MEVAHVEVRTRARALAAEETVDTLAVVKRRKVGNEKLRSPSSTFVQTKTLDRENYENSAEEDQSGPFAAAASHKSGDVLVSCCFSTGSTEKLKIADLEEGSGEIETVARYNLDGSESTPTSELKAESGQLDSTIAKPSSVMINSRRTVLPAEKMPPAAELEEFFGAAQKDLHKRFKDKYNYDIVNDIPLKGRFEWIQLKHKNEDEDDQ